MIGGRHDLSGHEACSAYHPVQKQGIKIRLHNYQAISILSLDSNLFGRVIMSRLQVLAGTVYPICSCGFRKNRSTIDIVFTLRLLKEKCIEQNKSLYTVFINFTRAFDTVSRTALYKVLQKI